MGEAMDTMDMVRGLLMLRPAMDMVMDMAMDMDMVMATTDMARGLLMLSLAMDMAMEVTAMDTVMDTAMDMAMDTAMDMDTMDKRISQKKFHTENNTKSSVSVS